MNPSLQYIVHSEAGDGHANEDVAVVYPHPGDVGVLLCTLADGQGGRAGGAEAARVAADESLRAASSFPVAALFEASPWYPVVSAADEAVCEEDEAGFCSLIALCISGRQVCGASCGDCAVLLLSGGTEIELTERQHKNPPVGSSAAQPVAFTAPLQPGWKMLIVSDGVWKYVGWEQMARIATRYEGQETIEALRRAALAANGGRMQDDFSVVLLSGAA